MSMEVIIPNQVPSQEGVRHICSNVYEGTYSISKHYSNVFTFNPYKEKVLWNLKHSNIKKEFSHPVSLKGSLIYIFSMI